MKLIITISTLLATALARPSYLTASPLALQNNQIASSYSSHQIIPGSASYQSYETLGIPQASLYAAPQIKAYNPYYLSSPYINPYQQFHYQYEPIAHQFLAPQPIGISHIPAYPSYIPQHPTFIAQHPSVIPQHPQFIGQIPGVVGTIPQNPVQTPAQPAQPNPIYPGSPNPPTGTTIDSDTVAVDAARSNKDNDNTEDLDDTVSIEPSPRLGEPLEKSTDEKKNEKIEENDSRTTYEQVVVAAKNNANKENSETLTTIADSNPIPEKQPETKTTSQSFPTGYPTLPTASRTFYGNPTYLANQNALSKLVQKPINYK